MKRKSLILLFALAALLSALVGSQPVLAAERTVELRTPGCVWDGSSQAIRIIVSRMEGVKSVEPNPIAQTTQIVFDDTKISIDSIIRELRKERYTVLGEPKYIK